jgi:hypothetical protein
MALALPILMILLFGYALTLDVDRVPTIVYDADHTPESRELISRRVGRISCIAHWKLAFSASDNGSLWNPLAAILMA